MIGYTTYATIVISRFYECIDYTSTDAHNMENCSILLLRKAKVEIKIPWPNHQLLTMAKYNGPLESINVLPHWKWN